MLHSSKLIIGLLLIASLSVGCQSKSQSAGTAASAHEDHDDKKEKVDDVKEAKVSAVLNKLSAEDRKLAESQKFCAVMAKERLGAMGTPLKIDIKGKPVFVCCRGCEKKALKNPDETLEKVAAMKANNETVRP